jgi:hypothetical protein
MTEATEARISTTDLARVALSCAQCGAETTVNVREPKQARAWEEGRALNCGVCQNPFENDVKRALQGTTDGPTLLEGARVSPTFRITRSAVGG